MGRAAFELGWLVQPDHAAGRSGRDLVESRPGSQSQSWAKKCGWARAEELGPNQVGQLPKMQVTGFNVKNS
ncbi:unnamed protein product [Prunus armeniaca]